MNFEIDHSLTTFTSEGKLNQCEDALKAALNGILSVSARSDDGIVLASLKSFPLLVEKWKVPKVNKVCDTIAMTYSGLSPDYRIIYEKACILVESYFDIYGRYPYVDVFVSNLSRVIQEYTQKGGLRPFGVLILVSGYIEEKINDVIEVIPILYQLEPSGSFQECKVSAIGNDYANAAKYIENRLEKLDDNIVNCCRALKLYGGVNVDHTEVDIAVFRVQDKTTKIYDLNDVKEIFDSME